MHVAAIENVLPYGSCFCADICCVTLIVDQFSIFLDSEIDEMFVLIFCLPDLVSSVRFVSENTPLDHSLF